MDAEIESKLRKAAVDAATLAVDPPPARTMTVREILADLSKVDGLFAEGKAVIEKILGLDSFEDKTALAVTVYKDPWQILPTSTDQSIPPTSSTTAASLASNEATVLKAKELGARIDVAVAEFVKAVESSTDKVVVALRTEIAKAGTTAAAKLDQIKTILKIGPDITDYDLRWKIGEVVGLLSQYAQVEAIIGDVGKSAGGAATPTSETATGRLVPRNMVWPSNLAAANYDRDANVFKRDDLQWGRDSDSGGGDPAR